MIEFQGWPKTPRLFRDMVVTEKIDGTNAAVIIEDASENHRYSEKKHGERVVTFDSAATLVRQGDNEVFLVGAQSRKRLITPDDDNFGFARWVHDNAADLVRLLGPGRHFGEWWGSGIQRGYGLTNGEKRFSLFNVHRYGELTADRANSSLPSLDVVPTLYSGPFATDDVEDLLVALARDGSHAAPGFARPEGVVVFHTASGQVFKALIENDAQPKGQTA